MVKQLISLVLVTALMVPGCGKKKPTSGSGSGTGDVAGQGSDGAGAAGAGGAGPNGAVWTAEPDPLQQAVLAATTETVALGGKKPSLIGALIDAVAAAHKAVARDAWDPAAVLAAVGKDRVALFNWVRDKTALVPYRGSLRGTVGVMMDRVGNSFDRSLLLADLLTRTGLEVRLANAQLDPALIAKLSTAWKARARPAVSTAHIDDDALAATVAKLVAADAGVMKAGLAKQRTAAEALEARTRARVDEQAKALAALVPSSGSLPPVDEAFADHWWVQVHDGEAWTDLDPSLPNAAPGEALPATATETLALADVNDDRRHVITVRVIGEVWHDDTREEPTLVDYTFAPNQFFGQRIAVSNVALDLPDHKTILAAKDPRAEAKKALIAQTEFAPLIRVGTQSVAHFSVNDRGELLDLRSGDGNTIRLGRAMQHATKDGVGGATDLLDQLPDDGSGAAAPAPPASKPTAAERPALTAEWLEIEIKAPGATPLVVRRTLFDTLGPMADRSAAKRTTMTDMQRYERALALLGETELLPMFAQLPPAFVVDRTVQTLVAAREPLIAVAAGKDLEAQRTKLATVPMVPSGLYSIALARFADPSIYLDRMSVLAVRQHLIPKDAGVAIRQEVDIMTNPVAVWPTVKDPRAARIAQGIRDTELEAQAIGCAHGMTCLRAPSTSETFSSTHGKGWSVVATPQGDAANDRANGYTIVAQTTAPQTWWRIDPATGETLGMNPMGGNAASEEIALQIALADQYFLGIASLAHCMYGADAFVGTPDARFESTLRCAAAAIVSTAGGVAGAYAGTAVLGLLLQMFSGWMT